MLLQTLPYDDTITNRRIHLQIIDKVQCMRVALPVYRVYKKRNPMF